MSRRAKLLEAVRNNTGHVRFADACRIAQWLGFIHKGGKGSHRAYQKTRRTYRPQLPKIEAAKFLDTKPSSCSR